MFGLGAPTGLDVISGSLPFTMSQKVRGCAYSVWNAFAVYCSQMRRRWSAGRCETHAGGREGRGERTESAVRIQGIGMSAGMGTERRARAAA